MAKFFQLLFPLLCLSVSCVAVCKEHLELHQLMADLSQIASDEMQGRKPGTSGHEKAQAYLIHQFDTVGLKSFEQYPNYSQYFSFGSKQTAANNILGYLKGSSEPEHYLVITAHYDHLGSKGKKVFNGANDNASGVAAMLALARYFSVHQPSLSMIFVATDAEESGLNGAEYFVEHSPVSLAQIKLNINLDMIGDSGGKNRLYYLLSSKDEQLAFQLESAIEKMAIPEAKVRPFRFHRRNKSTVLNRVNWHTASDHSAFKQAGVSFVYFGSDTDRYYHTERDQVERINETFLFNAVSAIIRVTEHIQQLKWPDKDAKAPSDSISNR